MGKYLLRRILQMIPVVLGTTLLVYALVFALPGDPVKAMFGDKPVNEAVAAQIRAEYHLDQPFIVQYFIYLKNALTLNFGDTFAGQPVLDEITRAFPVTIRLGLMAFVFEAIFGVVFGIISGLKKGKWYGQVMLRHVLRNSLIPVVTYLGQDIGALMGGAMITEQIFNIHGIGFLTYQSILKGEANLVVSIVTLLMLIFVVCNLVVDLLYAALDPRIRYA